MSRRKQGRTTALQIAAAASVGALLLTGHADASRMARRDEGSPNNTFVETAILSFMSSQRASWEQGVAASTMLETYNAKWSVFARNPPFGRATEDQREDAGNLSPVMYSMASSAMLTQDGLGRLCSRVTGDESTATGSSLDSASCGEAVLLAAYASGQFDSSGNLDTSQGSLGEAADAQLQYLLNDVPRTASGAISMRQANEAYWSDGLYMGPPFLALYGLLSNNEDLMMQAYREVQLYHEALRIPSGPAQGLLRHIVNGTDTEGAGQDLGAWLTGNGWGAAGMCRVIATLAQSQSSDMSSQIADMGAWAREIVTNSLRQGNPLIHNYVNDTSTFQDAGGSALIAYATFRLASLFPDMPLGDQLFQAENIYQNLQNRLTTSGSMETGWQVANPLSFTTPVQRSPESMSFLALMSSARRDYSQGNVTDAQNPGSANGALSTLQAPLSQQCVFVALLVCLFTFFAI